MSAAHAEPVVIVTTPEELRAIVRAEVRAALEAQAREKNGAMLDMSEVCDFLGVTPPTVRAYIRRSGLPCVRIGKSTVRFRREDVESWLESRRVR